MALTRAQLIADLEDLVYENTNEEVSGQDVIDALKLIVNNLNSLQDDAGLGSTPAYVPGSAYPIGQTVAIGGNLLRQSHSATFVSTDVEAEILAGKWAIVAGANTYRVVRNQLVVMPDVQYTIEGDLEVATGGDMQVYTNGQVLVQNGSLIVDGDLSNNGDIIIQ